MWEQSLFAGFSVLNYLRSSSFHSAYLLPTPYEEGSSEPFFITPSELVLP